MGYSIKPYGEFWSGGIFTVPKDICEKHLNFANEKQLKVLLLVLSDGGICDEEKISKHLSLDTNEVKECLDFWVSEGILSDGVENEKAQTPVKEETKKQIESLPIPSLTPSDIVNICYENSELADLLRNAETVMGASISNAMKSNLINMVNYYGLPVPVVITLLDYYKSQRDDGRNITTRTLQNMAKEWAGEEIDTLEKASKKLRELEDVEALWNEVIALCEFDYRKPSGAQLKMLSRWSQNFSREMIFFACNVMKKHNEKEKQSVRIVDNILKEWKRKGFKTPDDVKAPRDEKKNKKDDKKLKRKPSFDIDEIAKKAMLNDDYDI